MNAAKPSKRATVIPFKGFWLAEVQNLLTGRLELAIVGPRDFIQKHLAARGLEAKALWLVKGGAS